MVAAEFLPMNKEQPLVESQILFCNHFLMLLLLRLKQGWDCLAAQKHPSLVTWGSYCSPTTGSLVTLWESPTLKMYFQSSLVAEVQENTEPPDPLLSWAPQRSTSQRIHSDLGSRLRKCFPMKPVQTQTETHHFLEYPLCITHTFCTKERAPEAYLRQKLKQHSQHQWEVNPIIQDISEKTGGLFIRHTHSALFVG